MIVGGSTADPAAHPGQPSPVLPASPVKRCRGRPARPAEPADREHAGDRWAGTGLVFSTRFGTPIEPRNFARSFDQRSRVRRSTIHGTRKSCGPLLTALDVHLAHGHADPAAQQDRHHAKLSANSATSSAPEATAALCCCTSM